MTQEKFGEIVAEGIDAIPEKFLRKLSNVAIIIESNPTPEQRKKLKLQHNWTLFGLYEGIPQSARLGNYTGVLPDKITIFQKPIEDEAESEEEIKEIVRNTVWHEIAHHFGMDESRVCKAEERRKRK